MLSRVPVVSLSFTALLSIGSASTLEPQLPPPGEDVVGQVQVIKTKCEDTFVDLGEQYNLGYSEMIAASPGVGPWLSDVGTEVVIPTRFVLPPGPCEGVVISLAGYRLYYYPKGQNVVHTYPLDIGRKGWGSPIANTHIATKTRDPAWYLPASIRAEHAAGDDLLSTVVPPGPDNPLGPYRLTLGVPDCLIHGSNKKLGIGTRTSHGCFRIYNADVARLFSMISIDVSVRIINEPYKFGVSDDRVYLEAYTPLNDHDDPSVIDKHTAVVDTLLRRNDLTKRIQLSWGMVREVVASRNDMPIEITQESASAMTAAVDSDSTQLTP